MISLRSLLKLRGSKQKLSDTLIELAGIVLKHNGSEFEQLRETAIGEKFPPPYNIWFTADLEEKVHNASEEKLMIW